MRTLKRTATVLLLAVIILWAGGALSQTFSGGMVAQGGLTVNGVAVTIGEGLSLVGSALSVDTATVPTYLTDSDTLDFASISAGTCGEATFTVTGASPGDTVSPGWPNTIESNLSGMMYVESANTITARLCNPTSGAIDPASQTFVAWVNQSF